MLRVIVAVTPETPYSTSCGVVCDVGSDMGKTVSCESVRAATGDPAPADGMLPTPHCWTL
jgi:hypothetical protein